MTLPIQTRLNGKTIEVNCPFRQGSRNRHLFARLLAMYLDRSPKLFHLHHDADAVPARGINTPTRYFWMGYDLIGQPAEYVGTELHAVYLAGMKMRQALDRLNIVEFQQDVSDGMVLKETTA